MLKKDENSFRYQFKPYPCEKFSPLFRKAGSSRVRLNLFVSLNPAESTVPSIKEPMNQVPALCFDHFLTTGDLDENIHTPNTRGAIELNSLLSKYIQGDRESGVMR